MPKKKSKVKKINMPVILTISVVCLTIIIIGITAIAGDKLESSKYTEIKFSEMYETKNEVKDVSEKYMMLNGQKVVLRGYMAEQSPVDESFIYLVSQPYVVCPFCTLGDVTKLDVMSIYMANGAGIKFRNEPVDVYGTIKVEPAQDIFGYTTQFKILADSITSVEEKTTDPQLDAYFAQLNQDDLIFYITTTQTNMGWFLDIDYLYNEQGMDDAQIIETLGIKDNLDALKNEVDTCKNNIVKLKKIIPTDPKLAELNLELIDIYEKQQTLFEELVDQIGIFGSTEKTMQDKKAALEALKGIEARNLELFNKSNAWNNKLRE
jgi:hypothetical protein